MGECSKLNFPKEEKQSLNVAEKFLTKGNQMLL